MVPTTSAAGLTSRTAAAAVPDGGGSGDGILLELLMGCVKKLEAESPGRHGHPSSFASTTTTSTHLIPSNYLTAATTAGGIRIRNGATAGNPLDFNPTAPPAGGISSRNGAAAGYPFGFKPPPAGGTCSSSNAAAGSPFDFNPSPPPAGGTGSSNGAPAGNPFDFNPKRPPAGGTCSSSNAAAGNPFDFKPPPPPPQAVPLSSAAAVKPFSSIAAPRPHLPHLILPSSDSPISSPSGAGIHHHSPRKSPPSQAHSPRKSQISKPRCKRANNRAVAAACSKVLVANETNFRSIVEQHTAKPSTSPAASASPSALAELPSSSSAPSRSPLLLLEYPVSQTNVNPIATADLSILQTPNSMLLLQPNLPSSFDGTSGGNVSLLPHDYGPVGYLFQDDCGENFGGYEVPTAEWSLTQNGFENGESGGTHNGFESGEAWLNEDTPTASFWRHGYKN